MIVWIIGLPGAGKTALGGVLARVLRGHNPATVLLDGDSFREMMGNDLGYSVDDRRRNGWRLCRLGAFLDRQGIDVVCCVMSLFHEHQDWNRENVGQYLEVYLRVSRETLQQRDQKGLYSGASRGALVDVPAVDIAFPEPKRPDLVLQNDAPLADLSSLAAPILLAIKRRWRDDLPV